MKIVNMHIKFLEVEAHCPKCQSASVTDCGSYFFKDLPDEIQFSCPECEYEWKRLTNHLWNGIK
jgi:transposase-like protein